ncbi:ATP-grasp domain-containing protein [Peribacillus simplex]|uniref:ATP-grasp domain-containing protein n=1 Tax=Peribacillus simplex TaxID=1478 RepID=UPI000F63C5BA|nr:ATP-grasp domain-containing protein [Peribacillus simplex]RRN69915.1 ATP-grasp domain-containing protein [Peribacillus simplex]
MKKILIIGAGFLQSFVIKKAKDMGYHTITLDKNPNSSGFEYADEYDVVDIVDQEACLKYALSKNIDAVMTAATDYGVLSTAYIAQQMNLPGLDYEVAKVIKNKFMVRRVLFENNVDDVSQYYEVSDIEALNDISKKIHFPVMIKPCDGSGSKAARRVNSTMELKSACEEAIKSSIIGKALIEDFIEGKEYGVESFVYNGEAHVLGVMGKYMTNPPNYAELGHCIPSQLGIEEKVKEVVKNAINALGINFGAVNMDVLVTKDNRVCIVDIGARMGGNLIGSHIIPIGTGMDYMASLIQAAVGDSIDLKTQNLGRNVVTRLLALESGKVVNLPNLDEIHEKCHVDIYHQLKVGSVIREYQNNLDGCGYVVSVSNDIREAVRQAEEAKKLIDIGIIRENNRKQSF